VVPGRRPTDRYRRGNDIEQVIKGIDEDNPMYRITKMPREAEGADNRSYTHDGESRGGSPNDT
jgi:hypothetical protein